MMNEPSPTPQTETVSESAGLIRRQASFGWWTLLISLSLGIGLEILHAMKIGAYLNPANETRRLMWTLAHAHGTLLGLVNICFAITLKMQSRALSRWARPAANLLLSATVLVPSGFFLGGVKFYGGDPGIGIVLLPVGALFLLAGVFLTAAGLHRNPAAWESAPSMSEPAPKPGEARPAKGPGKK